MRSTTSTRSAALALIIAAILSFGGSAMVSSDSIQRRQWRSARAGRQSGGAAETVNGSIHIDPNAAVTTAKTVNGGVTLGRARPRIRSPR